MTVQWVPRRVLMFASERENSFFNIVQVHSCTDNFIDRQTAESYLLHLIIL